ncbi:hypothetical protein JW756_00365 [Candidatus Woesearchaeota archaeon]|nr:hypothetical protein [Candidatus Woesearchaeota archaeon]
MAEGIEIVIDPKKILTHGIYIVIIIVLAVLLITHWKGGSCDVDKQAKETDVQAGAGLNQTNQTNLTAATSAAILCSNGIKDQDESDVDCGGSTCDKCAEFKSCNVNADCESGWCRDSIKCLTPTCDDGVKNKDETNIDCGGHCKSTKGEFYYDGACHKEVKLSYSGRVDLTIVDVDTSVNSDSGYAKVESVQFKVSNGKEAALVVTAYIYARDRHGMSYYESSTTGDEIPMKTIEIPSLAQGANYTETVTIARTLTETEPDEEYQIVIELRDDDDELVKSATWTNS